MSHVKLLTPLAACVLITLFAAPVLAHEGVDHSTEAEAEAHLKTEGPLMKPLDFIKARAKELKGGPADARLEFKAGLDVGPDARMKGETGVRADVMRGHSASSTGGGSLKSLVLMHGGAIKNRFRLAIGHMDNILERIDSRLGKMANAGIETASVVKLKVEAEVAVDKAEADAKAVADFVASVDEGSDRAAVKAELTAKIRTAHQSLKAAHQAVTKVVRALAQLGKDNKQKIDAAASIETSVETETNVQ